MNDMIRKILGGNSGVSQQKLLILGSSKGCREMIEYAKSQGVWTIVSDFDDPVKSWAKPLADEYWMISADDFDALEKKCKEEHVNGVCCGISTFCIPCVIELSERLGLPAYNTKEAWHYTMNKYDFKALCRSCNVPVAQDYFVSSTPTEAELNKIKFPVVVKAVDQSANRGMSYCNTKEEILPAINYAHTFSKDEKVVIERMLHGIEYTAYYALVDGEASLVSLFTDHAQPGTPNNCYSVNITDNGHLDTYLEEVDANFRCALKKGGMTNGVCWIELILDEDGHFYVIEMGYRMSGDMMAIPIRDVCGFDSYKWLVDYALGEKRTKDSLPASQTKNFEKSGCAYILWSDDTKGNVTTIKGLEEILALPGVKMTPDVHEGSPYREHQYLLTFTFACKDVDGVCRMIEKINDTVSIVNEKGDDIIIRFTDYDTIKNLRNI